MVWGGGVGKFTGQAKSGQQTGKTKFQKTGILPEIKAELSHPLGNSKGQNTREAIMNNKKPGNE